MILAQNHPQQLNGNKTAKNCNRKYFFLSLTAYAKNDFKSKMKYLRIESTKFSPGIILDPAHYMLEFYGFSLPENAIDFYEPVLRWLNDFKEYLKDNSIKNNEINVIFKLVYYNSSSLRQLLDIFAVLSEIYHSGVPINISWQYDSEDPAMADSGLEIADIAKVPINIIAYN